jgi:CheY-like chemotaxis protein
MARILAVDDDALSRAVLVDALRGLGHDSVGAAEGEEGLARLARESFDLVITDVVMPVVDGLELARRIGQMPKPVPVLLVSSYGRGDLLARARAQGIAVAGFLPKPVDPDRLGRVLDGLLSPGAAADAQDDWSGGEFLARVAGPLERFPPARVLFLAHRIEATGAVHVRHGEVGALVGLRGGRIVHVAGVPGLLRALDPRIAETGDLAAAIGAAVLAGHAADRALQAAAEALGEYLARLIGSRGGEVRFDTGWTAPQGSFPLPEPIPRVIAAGLRRARAPAQVERTWAALDMATVRVRIPDDSPEARWGLDATTMRVLRLAPRARDLGDLVETTTGADTSRKADVLRAVEVLYLLGMLVVDGGPLDPVPDGSRTPPRVEQTREDTRLVKLRLALATMENAHPIDVLEVGDRKRISEDEVSNAYRDVSRRYHPDLYFNAPPVVRGLAEACFARVNAAFEQLRLPGGLVEAQRLLEARAAGVQYVSERDHVSARIAFRRGEILWRNRDWKGADAHFAEAFALDPHTWPHALYHAHCGWLAKRLSTAEAVALLEPLAPKEAARKAEVLVVLGNILKLAGRTDEAVAKWKAALEKEPGNHDAQRELRLHERRNSPPTPPPATGGFFSGLLKGKKP